MAFSAKGHKIFMDAYDYGLQLPVYISGLEYEDGDKIVFELKPSINSGVIFSKEFENISNDDSVIHIFLEFLEDEAKSLYPGNYVYYLRHIRNDEIKETIISGEDFVIKK